MRDDDLRRRPPRPLSAPPSRSSWPRARDLLARGRPVGPLAAGPAPRRCGRFRRRGHGRARRHRGGRRTTCSAHRCRPSTGADGAPRAHGFWRLRRRISASDADDRRRRRLRRVRPAHHARGQELRLRHRPAARPPKRDAMSAVYALARRIDDIARRAYRRRRTPSLDQRWPRVAEQIGGSDVATPDPDDAVLVALADVATALPAPAGRLRRSVEGCRRDSTGTGYATCPTFDDVCSSTSPVRWPASHRAARHRARSSAPTRRRRAARAARRRPRRGPAAHQHPARRPSRTVTTWAASTCRPTTSARFGCAPDLSGPAEAVSRRSSPLRGRPRAEDWYRRGLRAAAAPRPPQPRLRRPRWPASTTACSPHRPPTRPPWRCGCRVSSPPARSSWVAARSLAGRLAVQRADELTRPARRASSAAGWPGIAAALGVRRRRRRGHAASSGARLGGATWSFRHDGLRFDNGQHVFMRCCTEYRAFLERIGVGRPGDACRTRLDVPVRRPRRPRRSRLRRSRLLPAPLHLGRSLPDLPPPRPAATGCGRGRRRWRLAPGRPVDAADSTSRRSASGSRSMASRPAARDALWDLIVPPDREPAGDRGVAGAGREGVPHRACSTEPPPPTSAGRRSRWGSCTATAGAPGPRGAGVEVLAGCRSPRSPDQPRRVSGSQSRSPTAQRAADAVVVAVPHTAVADAARRTCPARDDVGRRLGVSPIVNVHVVYDRRVTDSQFAAGVDSPVQFVFDRTDRRRAPGGASTSRCRCPQPTSTWTGPSDDVKAAVVASLAELFPAGARRPGRRRPGLARAGGHVPGRARHAPAPGRGADRASRGWCWPGRGPPPGGRRPWRGRCAAATPPPATPSSPPGARATCRPSRATRRTVAV